MLTELEVGEEEESSQVAEVLYQSPNMAEVPLLVSVSEVPIPKGGKSSPCDCEPSSPVVGGWQEGDEGKSIQAGGQGAGGGEDHLCGELAQRRRSRVPKEGGSFVSF